MGAWPVNPVWVDPTNINGGKEYEARDGITAADMNIIINDLMAAGGGGGGGGALKLRIHYSETEAPTDTSKLWVKTNSEPVKVIAKQDFEVETPLELTTTTYAKNVTIYGPSRTVEYNGCLYTVGRLGSENNYDLVIMKYDINTHLFSLTRFSGTIAYESPAVALHSHYIYLFGGGDLQSNYTYTSAVRRIDLDNMTITTLSAAVPGTARYGMSAITVGNLIYLGGGTRRPTSYSYDNFSNLYAFDTTNNTFSGVIVNNSALTGMYREYVLYNNHIYIFGGRVPSSSSGGIQKTAYKLNLNTMGFTTLTAPPEQFQGARGVLQGTKVYLFSDNFNVGKELRVYDITSDTWETTRTIYQYSFGGPYYVCDYQNKVYILHSLVLEFPFDISVPEDQLLIVNKGNDHKFNIADQLNAEISVYVSNVYMGDSSGKGQPLTAALYDFDQNDWVDITP